MTDTGRTTDNERYLRKLHQFAEHYGVTNFAFKDTDLASLQKRIVAILCASSASFNEAARALDYFRYCMGSKALTMDELKRSLSDVARLMQSTTSDSLPVLRAQRHKAQWKRELRGRSAGR